MTDTVNVVYDKLVDEIESMIDECVQERIGENYQNWQGEDENDWKRLFRFICLELKNIHILDAILYPVPYYDDPLELGVANLKRVERGETVTTTFQKGDI